MHRAPLVCLAILFAASCAPASPSELDDLVDPDGKFDTGYYSSLAMELEGVFTGTIRLDLSDKSESERQAEYNRIGAGGAALRDLADAQVKLAKNQLGAERLHLSLTADNATLTEISLNDAVLTVAYTVTTETLVNIEEIKAEGIVPESLINQEFSATVASDPRALFTRLGDRCASGHDEGSLRDDNYFYYFDPFKQGCDLEVAAAAFEAKTLAPQADAFPEYDRLTADNKVEAAVFFGAAKYDDEVSSSDWGMREWRAWNDTMSRRGFAKTGGAPVGQRWSRTRAGLLETIDVISPTDLKAVKDDSDGVFARALKSYEILIYNGHSFYGSLDVLDKAENYPKDKYQIIFMNSCWSYEYYTKQVFENKATERDPRGWLDADVINDTESGWFHNMEEVTRIVMTNLLAGAEVGGVDEENRRYTWQRIIGKMNDMALARKDETGTDTHEIYGVSGVRTNVYQP